ncbi:MAG: HAD family phosphatase [Planctomycetes bacterium]|nr:HAD family phosphatase [Planctomycetota bacterium]
MTRRIAEIGPAPHVQLQSWEEETSCVGRHAQRASQRRIAMNGAPASTEKYVSDADIRGVIFDMDGVLVASGPAHAESWRVVARRDGIEITDADFKAHFGRPSRDIIRVTWGTGLSDEDVRRIDDAKEAAYRELIHGCIPLTAGVREILQGLRAAGLRLAIGTSGPRENVELVLTESTLAPYFDAVVTGFDVRRGKPAPDCFLLGAQRLRLLPVQCVVVEDAPVGIEAALAAGMPCIALVGTHPAERLKAAGATSIVHDLQDVTPALIAKLNDP